MMLISQSLGLAPSNPLRHEGCWAHGLGLGPYLGLGFLAWASYVKNTNRKNFKCFGPWPLLLLLASLFACWDDPSSIASFVIFMYFLVTSKWNEKTYDIYWFVSSYHTTPQSITKEMPFNLVYGSNAMIPVEVHKKVPKLCCWRI